MYHGDSRPQDKAADAAMTALYRELDQRDLPSDAAFDPEAGLRDLTARMHRETGRNSGFDVATRKAGAITSSDAPRSHETLGLLLDEPAASRRSATRTTLGRQESNAEEEFAGFYKERVPGLIAYLLSQGAMADQAADIAQEVMTAAYLRWTEISSPRAFVYTLARRAFLRSSLLDDPC